MPDQHQFLRETASSVLLTVHVQPRARKTGLAGTHGDAVKVKVAAPPSEGAANEELIRFFSELLGLPQSRISLKLGGTSRHKVLEFQGLAGKTVAEVLKQHGIIV